MRGKLLDSVQKHSIIDIVDHQVVAVICLGKAYSLENGHTAIDLCNTGLHCCVVQVHFAEFLIGWVLLSVLDERLHGFKARLSYTWSPNISV